MKRFDFDLFTSLMCLVALILIINMITARGEAIDTLAGKCMAEHGIESAEYCYRWASTILDKEAH